MRLEHRQQTTRMLIRHAKLTGQKLKRRKLPKAQYPRLIEVGYAAALRSVVAPGLRRAYEKLLAALPGIIARGRARARLDADDDDPDDDDEFETDDEPINADDNADVRALLAGALILMRSIDVRTVASRAAAQTSVFNRAQLGRQLEAGLGVNVLENDPTPSVVSRGFVDANVAYVRTLATRVSADVSADVFRAIQNSVTAATVEQAAAQVSALQEQIADRLEAAERRVQVAARIEVGKLYSQINTTRQRKLGVERFVWRTMQDDKVRDEHEERDGETYSYDDPPDGELPGEPPMCRCWAEPVLDDLDEDADTSDDEDDSDE